MALTKIFTGMEKGPEAIDANFTTLNGASPVVSEWSTTGLSYQNSWSALTTDMPNTLQYRTIDAGGHRTIQFAGYIEGPAMDVNYPKTKFVTFPTSLLNGHTSGFLQKSGMWTNRWSDQWMRIDVDLATASLTFMNESMRGDKTMPASSYEINFSISW